MWAEGLRERDPVSKVKTNRSAIWGRRAIAAVALSAFLILGQGSAWAKGKKAKDLKSGNGSDVVDVIVQYNQDVDKGEANAKGHGAHIHHKFNAIKALAMASARHRSPGRKL